MQDKDVEAEEIAESVKSVTLNQGIEISKNLWEKKKRRHSEQDINCKRRRI